MWREARMWRESPKMWEEKPRCKENPVKRNLCMKRSPDDVRREAPIRMTLLRTLGTSLLRTLGIRMTLVQNKLPQQKSADLSWASSVWEHPSNPPSSKIRNCVKFFLEIRKYVRIYPWISMDDAHRWYPWMSIFINGYSTISEDVWYPWISIGIRRHPWISVDAHGAAWIARDLNGYPGISQEIHTSIKKIGFSWTVGFNKNSMGILKDIGPRTNFFSAPLCFVRVVHLAMVIYGHPWGSMEIIYGDPWRSMDAQAGLPENLLVYIYSPNSACI